MSKRLKSSIIFSAITSVLAAILWFLYIYLSGRHMEQPLEGTLLFGVINFPLLFGYSYMITYRRI